ncbi:protein YecG-like family [Candidatus Termititenax persephonae]|uniref:Endolytic murein transglycosylase n=1 Tax=Candidatus Termititenax persephonae TaxID=2218525 RepID=A0A388TJZ0_9BACT|nr:protein YecG-like family [Candidatus Termititenax persephonae]
MLWSAIFLGVADSFSRAEFKVAIPRHAATQDVLTALQVNKIVRNPWSLKLAVRLGGYDKKIHAGEYLLSPSMSLKRIFETLSEQRGLSLTSSKQVVIPEGYSLQEIVEVMDRAGVVSQKTFADYFARYDPQVWRERYSFLQDNKLTGEFFFEGYLYPDTYIFAEDTTPEAALDFMLGRFEKKIYPRLREAVGAYNLHELLTLASIVEKEAVFKAEMPLIAGVYYNRLRIRMHLGSCPTIKYALGNPRKKEVLYRDLEIKSPYNTYKNYDLPPSPICSPGLNAIDAVVDTPKTTYLYFFAKGDGTSVFSNTYEEHLRKQGANPSFLYNSN